MVLELGPPLFGEPEAGWEWQMTLEADLVELSPSRCSTMTWAMRGVASPRSSACSASSATLTSPFWIEWRVVRTGGLADLAGTVAALFAGLTALPAFPTVVH